MNPMETINSLNLADSDPDVAKQSTPKTLHQIEVLLTVVQKVFTTISPEFRRTYIESKKPEATVETHLQNGIDDIREMRITWAKLEALKNNGVFDEDDIRFCDHCRDFTDDVIEVIDADKHTIFVCRDCRKEYN